jgi:diguanylate cyclase (GGDEF)-like protein
MTDVGARPAIPFMPLHLPTLLLLDVYVLALLGALMLHAWWRSESEATLGCMAGMLLLAALGTLVVSLRGVGLDGLSIVLGNVLLQLACGLGWAAMRLFVGRPLRWPTIAGGALLWVLLCLWPVFMASLPLRVAANSLLTMLYTALAARELWRARHRQEVSIAPALFLLLTHFAFFGMRLLLDHGEGVSRMWSAVDESFLNWLVLETFLFAIGIAFVTLAMVRERAELRYRAVANSDPLTGIGNRRAFMERAAALLDQCRREQRPAALLLCDLDYFKRLNDTHGHAMGDTALVAFAGVLAGGIRAQDVCGRIGGEEFACLLPDADQKAVAEVAERIRCQCGELSIGVPQRLSVSIGVASTVQAGHDLAHLLAQADEALYRAKAGGRDRVEHCIECVLPA